MTGKDAISSLPAGVYLSGTFLFIRKPNWQKNALMICSNISVRMQYMTIKPLNTGAMCF